MPYSRFHGFPRSEATSQSHSNAVVAKLPLPSHCPVSPVGQLEASSTSDHLLCSFQMTSFTIGTISPISRDAQFDQLAGQRSCFRLRLVHLSRLAILRVRAVRDICQIWKFWNFPELAEEPASLVSCFPHRPNFPTSKLRGLAAGTPGDPLAGHLENRLAVPGPVAVNCHIVKKQPAPGSKSVE